MSIRSAAVPESIKDLAAREAGAMRRAFRTSDKLAVDRAGGPAMTLGDVFPVYYLPHEQLSADASAADAQQVGWRCLMTEGSEPGTVDVRGDKGAEHVAAVTLGRGAVILTAARAAAERAVAISGPYEARILEFGRAGPGALWLHSGQGDDHFFALDDFTPRELTEREVIGAAAHTADLLRRAYPPRRGDGGAAFTTVNEDEADDLGG